MDKRIYLTKILGNFVESGIGRQITGMWSEMIQNRSFRPKSEYKYPMWSWLGLWKDKYNENAPFWHSGYEENDVGIDEFMDLSEMVGFEPQICINMMTSSPFKARQQIEYLNADENTGMGRWRMLNGHKEPYNVRLIELDNEPGRKWTCVQYAHKCCEFIKEKDFAKSKILFYML